MEDKTNPEEPEQTVKATGGDILMPETGKMFNAPFLQVRKQETLFIMILIPSLIALAVVCEFVSRYFRTAAFNGVNIKFVDDLFLVTASEAFYSNYTIYSIVSTLSTVLLLSGVIIPILRRRDEKPLKLVFVRIFILFVMIFASLTSPSAASIVEEKIDYGNSSYVQGQGLKEELLPRIGSITQNLRNKSASEFNETKSKSDYNVKYRMKEKGKSFTLEIIGKKAKES